MNDGQILISIIGTFGAIGGLLALGAKPFIAILKKIEQNAIKQGETNEKLTTAIHKLTSSVDVSNSNQGRLENFVAKLEKEHKDDMGEIYITIEKINDAYDKRFEELAKAIGNINVECAYRHPRKQKESE